MGAEPRTGTDLLRLRESVRVSLRELAQASGVSRNTLARIEAGEREPSAQERCAILRALNSINEARQRQFRQLVQTVGTNCPKTS